MIILATSTVASLLVASPAAPRPFADGPLPIRAIAPDNAYVVVAADGFARTVEKWRGLPLHRFLETPEMKKVLGDDGGAQEAMSKRLEEDRKSVV